MYALRVKKVTKPSRKEEAIYYSDFSGKCFGECGPDITITLEFGYGSKYDGSSLELHLSDEDLNPLIIAIKNNISQDYKKILETELTKMDEHYENSVQARDWFNCETICNSADLIKHLLDK